MKAGIYEADDWEFADHMRKLKVCEKCGGEYPQIYFSTTDEDICKFCTGEYVNPCKDCLGEDCNCCSNNPNLI